MWIWRLQAESVDEEAGLVQIRSLIITFLTYVAPGLSGALLLPAAWFLVLCPVRPSCT